MKLKNLLLAGIVSIFALSLANAKSYDIIFSSPTQAGNLQLKPGEYRLSVKGNQATFLDVNSSKAFTTNVKIENKTAKYNDTEVLSDQNGGTNVVKSIDLGGSKTQVDF